MTRTLVIFAAVVAVVFGAFALDWWVIGAGPVTAIAKSRCVDAERAELATYYTDKRDPDTGALIPKTAPKGRTAAKELCDEAARDGRLTLRGGID